MSEPSRLSTTVDDFHPSRAGRPRPRCDVVRATLIATPLPLLIVGVAARPVAVPPSAWAAVVVAIGVAAGSAAIAARWCAERRMRSEIQHHERELAYTKRQILALVSHELRTPVTGVVGFSRTLSGRLDDLDHHTLRLFVDAIDEHSRRLARLIDNVVVASRTPLVVVDGTCQLSQALSQAVARVGLGACERSRLRISMDGALDARIDEEAAIRIVANLIDNALKFGDPDGRVHLDGQTRDGRVVLRVANAGPAIPLGLRAALYAPFVQGDITDTRTSDGLGLGLHVCRQLVEAYGGTIDLVDHPRLTVFEITLPAARRPQAGDRRRDAAAAQPSRRGARTTERRPPEPTVPATSRAAHAAPERERVG